MVVLNSARVGVQFDTHCRFLCELFVTLTQKRRFAALDCISLVLLARTVVYIPSGRMSSFMEAFSS